MRIPTLDSQLCFALYSASSHVTNIYRPLLDVYDLTYPQFMVLLALWEEDSVSISTLAKRTSVGKPTMTPLLKRLEEKKLITRQVSEDDDRKRNIVLTAAGRKLSQHSRDITNEAFCSTGLSKSEAGELIKLCRKLTKLD